MNRVTGKPLEVDIYNDSPSRSALKVELDKVLRGQEQFSPSNQKDSILMQFTALKEEKKQESKVKQKQKQQEVRD